MSHGNRIEGNCGSCITLRAASTTFQHLLFVFESYIFATKYMDVVLTRGLRWMDCKLLVYDVVTVYYTREFQTFLRAIRGFLHCSLRSETEGKCFVKFFCLQVIGKAESKCEPNVKFNIVSIWVFRSLWEFNTVLSFYREMLNKTLPFFHLVCRVVLPELVNIFPPIWLKHFKPIAEIKRADFYG